VLAHWDWEAKIWGWDYPMIAMTAARLGRPEKALMIAGWDGCQEQYPGFPKNGTWNIRAEGWHALP
jgi:hypothetical protein